MTNCPMRSWHRIDLATNSFGQGLSVTPIQMVRRSPPLPTGGRMFAPHVVKAIVSRRAAARPDAPVTVGAPISTETAQTLNETAFTGGRHETEGLEGLVDGLLASPERPARRKSPTARRLRQRLINASFIGWGPTDDPQFLVYVWLRNVTSDSTGDRWWLPRFSWKSLKNWSFCMEIPPDATSNGCN